MELADLVAAIPFAQQLGVVLTRADRDGVEGTLAWSEDRCTTGGIMHGGALMAFVDTLGAVSAGEVHATTTPVHVGRRTIVLQTEVRDDNGKLVAMTTQTQAVTT